MNAKEKELMKQLEIKKHEMKQLEKQLEKLLQKKPKEPPKNLCPECSFFCEERFTDGICK